MVPQVWVTAADLAGSTLDDGEIDAGPDAPQTPLFFWPYSEPLLTQHGWAFERTSAGYAWGEGFTGSFDPAVRICLIGVRAAQALRLLRLMLPLPSPQCLAGLQALSLLHSLR